MENGVWRIGATIGADNHPLSIRNRRKQPTIASASPSIFTSSGLRVPISSSKVVSPLHVRSPPSPPSSLSFKEKEKETSNLLMISLLLCPLPFIPLRFLLATDEFYHRTAGSMSFHLEVVVGISATDLDGALSAPLDEDRPAGFLGRTGSLGDQKGLAGGGDGGWKEERGFLLGLSGVRFKVAGSDEGSSDEDEVQSARRSRRLSSYQYKNHYQWWQYK